MTDAPPMVCYWRGVIDSLVNKLTDAKEMHPKVDTLLEDLLTLRDDLVVNKFAGARPWQVQVWMRQNRKLFYDIEDIIDLKLSKIKDVHESDSDDFAKQIDQFKARIKEACDRGRRYGLPDKARTFDADHREDAAPSKVPFGSWLIWEKKGVLVGIGGPREELEDHLEDTQKKKKVVSVHGMGGVGKTTLATKVYEEFIGQFDCHASVTVGRNSSIAVLMDVLLQVNPVMVGRDLKEQDVIPQLWEFLENKRYLVFIDDIRNEHAWRVINCALPNNELRSRILVTTRVKNVAISCSVPPIDAIYEMKRLKEHDSTILLDSMIPAHIEASFEKKCEEMLKMCCGLPLAIIVASGLLALKSNDLGSLGSLEESSLSMLDQYSPLDGMRNVLDICFADLSLPVKACFLYLSTFPENYNIKKGRLIWRWVAEGFIPKIGQASMWETGEGYFKELICRRLIRPVFDDYSDDQAVACTVHPVIHDFIAALSRQEDFHTTAAELIAGQFPYDRIRRFSVDCSRQENNEADTMQSSGIHLSRVRSLTVFGSAGRVLDLETFKYLRVLDLEDNKSLDDHQAERIELLYLLRYLGLAGTNITNMPQQIIMALKHLITLDLRRTKVGELPSFGNNKLVCLFAPFITIARGMEGLEELEELSEVLLGHDVKLNLDGSHATDVIELLSKSRKLRALGVKFGHLEETESGAMECFLEQVGNSNLQSLSFYNYPCDLIDLLIECCCASKWPNNPGKFELRMSYCLPRVPLEIASMEALTHLHIQVKVVEAEGVSALGSLPNLILLKLFSEKGTQVRLSVRSEDGFRSLKVFWFMSSYFHGMGLQFHEGAMPSLQRLKIEFNARTTKLFYQNYDFGIQYLRCLLQVCAIIYYKDATDLELKDAEAAIRDQVSQIRYDPLPMYGVDLLASTTSNVDIRISILSELSSHLPHPAGQGEADPGEQLQIRRNKRSSGGTSDSASQRPPLRQRKEEADYRSSELSTSTSSGKGSDLQSTLQNENIPASFLTKITENFSDYRKLGEGTFGTVYQGILPEGGMISVQKLRENSQVPQEKQFVSEFINLKAMQHDNIVKLVGYCYELHTDMVKDHDGEYIIVNVIETFLCYEYLPRGSLDKYLFESRGIDWDTRFNIIKGICKGLHFLHTGMDTPVVHMDIRLGNILLDNNMAPKISDSGLSRIFGPEQTRMYTKNVVGALGYVAPEYLYRGEISTQADIYSLGIVIIQISTGDKITPNNDDKCGIKFIKQVRQKWTPHQIKSTYATFDARRLHEVQLCIQIGLECVQVERKKRPSIVDIIDRLNGKR